MDSLYYVLGTTCAGKDWFMEKAQELYPEDVGLVQVGKEFRRRYPPGYFQGSASPLHTEQEALNIFEEQLDLVRDKRIVFVAGQPRRVSQIDPTINKYQGQVLWIYAEEELLKERAHSRTNDPAVTHLSLCRITNDKVQLFDVLYHLMAQEHAIIPIHTKDAEQWIKRLLK